MRRFEIGITLKGPAGKFFTMPMAKYLEQHIKAELAVARWERQFRTRFAKEIAAGTVMVDR